MKTALVITGSGSNGGTDVQADTRTTTAHGVYAISAITTLATQNITGVTGTMEVAPSFLKERLDSILTDIFPDVVKIGMAFSGSLVGTIGDKLALYRAVSVVVGPAMVPANGSRLISGEAIEALREILFPMANLLIPNIPEAGMLSRMEVHNPGDVERVARTIGEGYGYAILLEDGHQFSDTNDLLCRYKKLEWLNGGRINSPNTHGTGCILFSVIVSNLARGMDVDLAVERAEVYLLNVLKAQLGLGKGNGPMNHGFAIRGEY